jgi:hypothetical protein
MLTSLIKRANTTYALHLDDAEEQKIYWTLRQRYGQRLKTVAASTLIDSVLAVSDELRAKSSQPHNVYAGMKVEADGFDVNECPRCRSRTNEVLLVADRHARYCLACNITLPVKSNA